MQYKYPPEKRGKKYLTVFVHYRGHNYQAGSQEDKV